MLTNPEARRGLRAVVQAISALAGIGFLAWLIWLLATDAHALLRIALCLLGITAMREVFYGAENVTRALEFKLGPNGLDTKIGEPIQSGDQVTVVKEGSS